MARHSVMEIIRVVDWDALRPLLTQLLCVPAVIIASQLSLGLYITITSLTPPAQLSREVTSSEDAASAPLIGGNAPHIQRSLRKRLFGHKVIRPLLLLTAFTLIEAVCLYSIYRINSQIVRDGVFAGIWGGITAMGIYAASYRLWPVAETLSYARGPSNGKLKLECKRPGHSGRRRFILSSAFSLLVLGTAYAGVPVFHPFVAAAGVLAFVAQFRQPKLRMKRVVLFLLAYELVLPVITGIILSYQAFSGGETADEIPMATLDVAEPSTDTNSFITSEWVMSVPEAFQQSFRLIVPGVVMAMSLRLDSALCSNTNRLRQTIIPGATLGRVSGFPAPLFSTGVVALLLSIFGMNSLPFLYPTLDLQALGVFVYTPMVIGSIALKAWAMGLVRVWWDYEEIWIPKEEGMKEGSGTDASEVNDVEKALDIKA